MKQHHDFMLVATSKSSISSESPFQSLVACQPLNEFGGFQRDPKRNETCFDEIKDDLRCFNHKLKKGGLILGSIDVGEVQPSIHCKHHLHLLLWSHITTFKVKKRCYNFSQGVSLFLLVSYIILLDVHTIYQWYIGKKWSIYLFYKQRVTPNGKPLS